MLPFFHLTPSLPGADCPFFLGVAAISSVPLALIEVATIFELPTATELLRAVFAISFLIVRTFTWPVVSFGFWSDVFVVGQAGGVHSYFAMGFFLVANIGLTGLQWFWTTLIIDGIRKTLSNGKKSD